jgi:hypothetical protein
MAGPPLFRRVGVVALALVVSLSACASEARSGSQPADRAASSSSSTEATTTTISAEDQALAYIAGLQGTDAAKFDLFAHPPQFPPPLAPTPPPPPGTPDRRVEIVQIGPDRQPVFDGFGNPQLFAIHFDYLDQFVRNETGDIAIEGSGSLVNDDAGQPILLTPAREPNGDFTREPDGRARLVGVPQPPPLNPVLVVGDSVILGAAANLPQLLPGWDVQVDAEEGRLAGHTASTIAAHRGDIRRAVVVMVGHNSGAGEDHAVHIRSIMRELEGVERVVWVTAAEWGPGQAEFNAAAHDIAASGEFPNMVVADWALYNRAYPEYSYDGLHLTPNGRVELARLIHGFLGPAPEVG